MVAKPRHQLREATCEHLLLLAVFGDDAMKSRVDGELDRRARLRDFMSAGAPDRLAGRRSRHVHAGPCETRPLRLSSGKPALAG